MLTLSQSQSATPALEVLGNLIPLLACGELLRLGLGIGMGEVPLARFYTLYCLWLSLGHIILFATNSFPKIRRSSWVKGNLTAVIGIFWPLWLALSRQPPIKTN